MTNEKTTNPNSQPGQNKQQAQAGNSGKPGEQHQQGKQANEHGSKGDQKRDEKEGTGKITTSPPGTGKPDSKHA